MAAQQFAVEGAILEAGRLCFAYETASEIKDRCCKRCADLAVGKRGGSRSVCNDAAELYVTVSSDSDRSRQGQVLERGVLGIAKRCRVELICFDLAIDGVATAVEVAVERATG